MTEGRWTRRVFAALLLLAAACGENEAKDEPPLIQTRPSRSGDGANGIHHFPITDQSGDPKGNITSAIRAGGFSSFYTTAALVFCGEAERAQAYVCPNYGDLRLFVTVNDNGRYDFDVGADDKTFDSRTPGWEPSSRVEWRLKDGAPFAIITRYLAPGAQSKTRFILAVERFAEGRSCVVGFVSSRAAEPYLTARQLADEAFGKPSCANAVYRGAWPG